MRKIQITSHQSPITSKSDGFTLIEVLVSSALLVILSAAFVGLQYILSQNQVSAWRNYQSIELSNSAVTSVSKELRNAHNSETGAYSLVTAGDQSIVFYSDYDYDGIVERMRYTLTGNQLVRGVIEPTGSPYAYNIANEKVKTITDIVRNGATPLFYYYNSDWPDDTTNNPLVAASRISQTREIKIHLVTNPKSSDPTRDFTLDTFVKVRMFNQ